MKNLVCSPDANTSILHLELLRVDLAVRRAVQSWQQSGQDPDRKFRGLYIDSGNIQDILSLPIGGDWSCIARLPAELENDFSHHQAVIQDQIAVLAGQAVQYGHPPRLHTLRDKLGLSSFEYDALLLCMAPALDSRYEKIYGYLQDDVTRKYAGTGLIFDLLLPPGLERLQYLECFNTGPLVHYGLIHPLKTSAQAVISPLQQAYLPAPEIIAWLTGIYRPADEFHNSMRLSLQENEPLSDDSFSAAEIDLNIMQEQKPFVILYGQDDLQQHETARFISAGLNRPLLEIDVSKVDPQYLADGLLTRLALRDAALNSALPCFTNWEKLSSETGLWQKLFSDLNHCNEIILLQCTQQWQIQRNGDREIKPVMWIKCDLPGSTRRLQIWEHFLKPEDKIPSSELEMLAGQFTLTSSQIRNAVYTARDTAMQNNHLLNISDLFAAARRHSSHHLESLAVKIPPRYGWQDIVLPEDELCTLHEIAETVRWRSTVLEEWGLGERLMPNAGISALFAGPSGTGKTLAAQVIAAELNMDLYKIDLSTVVSKYIGETEKNLERIFTQAHNSNSILFFDEADAIFGKRSEVKDAHDRYANIEVGYLLQRMETYDGVVILATNLRANLDDAFTRRLQFVVDFPLPDEEERLKIWNVLFPPGVPREPGIDFRNLAVRFKLTGGNIRNIIIGAAFLAASQSTPVSMNHILHALRREMQNMGRLVNENDLSTLSKEDKHGQQTT